MPAHGELLEVGEGVGALLAAGPARVVGAEIEAYDVCYRLLVGRVEVLGPSRSWGLLVGREAGDGDELPPLLRLMGPESVGYMDTNTGNLSHG